MNSLYETFLMSKNSFVCTQLKGFKYFYVMQIQFNIGDLFAHS